MNAIARALRDFLAERPAGVGFALVGGLAVSARTEPRFTRDLDFAIAVADDCCPRTTAAARGIARISCSSRRSRTTWSGRAPRLP